MIFKTTCRKNFMHKWIYNGNNYKSKEIQNVAMDFEDKYICADCDICISLHCINQWYS